jgi:hypothetical protein
LLFILAPLVVLLTGVIGNPMRLISVPMMLAPMIIVIIGYPIAIWLTARQYKDFRLARFHNDILADSVAAKVTSNPDSLAKAIAKVRDAVKEAPRMPSESIGFTNRWQAFEVRAGRVVTAPAGWQ